MEERNHAVTSAEALLRWAHPDGIINPIEFIPRAEETGSHHPDRHLGPRTSLPATRHVAAHDAVHGDSGQRVCPATGRTGHVEVIKDVLSRTQVRPETVCLELTESVFMGDADYFGSVLTSLKDLGVKLSIDDFGTGYSSLSYLKRFPVDALKIDQSFVAELGTDPHYLALVASVTAMSDALGLTVTAEGVENHEQLTILERLQCQRAQGYYFSRPMPAGEMSHLLDEYRV